MRLNQIFSHLFQISFVSLVRKNLVLFFSALFIFVMPGTLKASNGIRVIGPDAQITAMGGAGVAMPTTPAAAFLNPAGFKNSIDQAELALAVIFPDLGMGSSLAPAGNPDAVNASSTNATAFLPAGGVVSSVWDGRIALGLSFYSSGGVQVEYPVSRVNSAFTNNAYDNSVLYANLKIIPGFSIEVVENLTLGAGLDINYSFLETNSAVPAPGFPETTGSSQLDSALGIGGRIGLIYEPLPWLKVGATYLFRNRFQRFDRYADLFFAGVDLPQQVAVGLAFLPMDGMSILADFRWIDWSSGIIGTSPLAGGFGWRDQYVAAIGFSYDFDEKFSVPLAFRIGYNYGSSPISSPVAFANLLFPPIVEHNLATGLGIDFHKYFSMDLTYLREFPNTITDDGSLNPAGTGAFTSASSNTLLMSFRGHWGRSAKQRSK